MADKRYVAKTRDNAKVWYVFDTKLESLSRPMTKKEAEQDAAFRNRMAAK